MLLALLLTVVDRVVTLQRRAEVHFHQPGPQIFVQKHIIPEQLEAVVAMRHGAAYLPPSGRVNVEASWAPIVLGEGLGISAQRYSAGRL